MNLVAEKPISHPIRPTGVHSLHVDLDYLEQIIKARLKLHSQSESEFIQADEIPRPKHRTTDAFSDFFNKLPDQEHIVLLIALAPHVQPDFFDRIIAEVIPQGGDLPQIGGMRGQRFRGFLPTGETVLFLLAGNDLERRFDVQRMFSEDHLFARQHVLRLERPPAGEPLMSGQLVMDPEYIDLLTLGHVSRPRFSMDFPAQLVSTEMIWDDLVLPDTTFKQIQELHAWVKHGDTLLNKWGLGRKLKPGYRALFHGPPGTGKTLTASLLGKSTGRDVYRIDLSMVVSKFIGETEKNLSTLFDKAENKNWILCFDEADALFGKRTNVRDAHDKYANQEVSYLLQRIEACSSLVILASNYKSNIDEAFMRRFQLSVHFPLPRATERERLWRQAFPAAIEFADDVNLDHISRKYEISGSHIMNVVQYACLRALDRGDNRILALDIETGIHREMGKEGKVL